MPSQPGPQRPMAQGELVLVQLPDQGVQVLRIDADGYLWQPNIPDTERFTILEGTLTTPLGEAHKAMLHLCNRRCRHNGRPRKPSMGDRDEQPASEILG